MSALRVFAGALGAVALLIPASAQAVTLGNPGVDDSTVVGAPGPATVVQTASSIGSYVVPPGSWAVTSVSARLNSGATDTTASVLFFRPGEVGRYTVVGGAPLSPAPNLTDTVVTRPAGFNVQGDDRLGATWGPGVRLRQTATQGEYDDSKVAAPAAGSPFERQDFGFAANWAITATLEPDADADGIPDASDNCPGTAGCRTDVEALVQVNPSSVLRGRTAQVAATVNNRGTDPASGVSAIVSLPKGVTVLSSGNPALCPLRQSALTCRFGTLDRGAQRTVYLRVKATTEGAKSISLTAAHAGVDPVGGNNRSFIALNVRKTCVVPSKGLKGQTLRTAKRRLKSAGCSRTRTVRPKRVPRGYVLRVSDVSPKATQEASRRITITLKARKRKS